MANASLSFLPWTRQGAASAITVADTLGPRQSAVADVTAALTLNGQPVTMPSIRLRGPADVIGIDPNQVVRTDPRPGTTDFEPNCFPSIEFDRADFPWLFTPARQNPNTQLRPWLCLVVVRKQDGVTFASAPDVPLPTLQIATPARADVELPDLKESWAWAHAQVAADDSTQPKVTKALNGGPELSLSRLVCPRILAPDTDYIACVVPAFDLGRKAGLGQPIADKDLTAVTALAPAWTSTPPPAGTTPASVVLPVFYRWEFRTGHGGDFESIVRRLTPSVAEGLGKRPIDISAPGFPVTGVTTVDLEGALLPIPPAGGSPPTPPPVDPIPLSFKTSLGSIVNKPGQVQVMDPNADPVLAPPLYGRWHAGRAIVSPIGTTWLDQLNLDPRWRVAAAFGTRVVQEHQEALMASAWEQAGQLANINQRMRQLQLSLAVGEVLHARHFAPLSEEAVLRIAAPAFGRLRQTSGASLLARQITSRLPLGANRSAMRRIGRLRGPLSRRVALQGFPRSAVTWVARLNDNMSASLPPAPPPPPPPAPGFAVLPPLALQNLASSFYGAFFVAAENAAVNAPGMSALVPNRTELPGFFRAAAAEHLARFFPPRVAASVNFSSFSSIKQQVLDDMRPRRTLPVLANAILSKGDNVLAPTAPGVAPIGVETVMAAPSFTQPMYEELRDISADLFLPGLDAVKPDTVLGLKTNRRFVESYMVGLNHEMGRELLWRGYPTDQRGTYFSHFWGSGVPNTAPADVTPLHVWKTRSLADTIGSPAPEEFVMLLRSDLLRRYPNAVIYLTPAVMKSAAPPATPALAPDEEPAHETPPIFSGAMPPDVSFFGFPVTTDKATGKDGGLGYYVVIQEHPTEPRFGLDVGTAIATTHLVVGTKPPAGVVPPAGHTWGKNSAHMAGITRRLPVRIAIHASRLVAQAGQPGVPSGLASL